MVLGMSYEDSYEDDVDELEEIKRRKLAEYQRRLEAEKEAAARKAEEEALRQELLRRILTPEARARLTNLKLVKPELVETLEVQLIQLAQTGRVKLPIDDETLKEILAQLSSTRRDIRVKFSF
jgi:programmed cell death protein 5